MLSRRLVDLRRVILRTKVGVSRRLREPGESVVQVPGSPDIYRLSGGFKRYVPSMTVFDRLGFDVSGIRIISADELAAIPNAPPTLEENYDTWRTYDWSKGGEEWTKSPEWKQSVIDDLILKYIQPGNVVLEIGPGAGRWTETLQRIATQLVLVDISDACIDACRERFANSRNIQYFVNDGKSLDFLGDGAIDFIWSFETFVHISPKDTASYFRHFNRILSEGGIGIIHHPGAGSAHGGWRSEMTADLFATLLEENGLVVSEQFDSWGEGESHVKVHKDAITVFRHP